MDAPSTSLKFKKNLINYGYDMTVGINCSNLLSVYLFRFQLHLLFVFATTMIMVSKDYHYHGNAN